ncbi:MAG TPA: hypothetical protein ENK07_01490 [Bacteroidetes bacterium]|nr:hypothetical protein [Bacteroidota bacterium]
MARTTLEKLAKGYVLAALLLVGCGRPPEKPRVLFHAGVEIWRPQAAVLRGDSVEVLHASSWNRDRFVFSGDGSIQLALQKVQQGGSGVHAWLLTAELVNTASTPVESVKAVAPVRAIEREGGFLEFSTGEPARVCCIRGDRVDTLGVLQPGEGRSVTCDTLALVQPISRVALLLIAERDTSWTTTWRVRRQKRRKRQYDLELWERPAGPFSLSPGERRRLPAVLVRVLTGREVARLTWRVR